MKTIKPKIQFTLGIAIGVIWTVAAAYYLKYPLIFFGPCIILMAYHSYVNNKIELDGDEIRIYGNRDGLNSITINVKNVKLINIHGNLLTLIDDCDTKISMIIVWYSSRQRESVINYVRDQQLK